MFKQRRQNRTMSLLGLMAFQPSFVRFMPKSAFFFFLYIYTIELYINLNFNFLFVFFAIVLTKVVFLKTCKQTHACTDYNKNHHYILRFGNVYSKCPANCDVQNMQDINDLSIK